jgi:acyl dehydratase
MNTPADLSFAEIKIGAQAFFTHKVTKEDVDRFAVLSGDFNPLHLDSQYAATTDFGRPIVHGMFLASLFSRLVGMYIPGKRCLYLSQSLDFVQPVYVGEEIRILGEVKRKEDATKTLVIATSICVLPGRQAVRGKAYVKVLE